jgi:subtilase family serine protease
LAGRLAAILATIRTMTRRRLTPNGPAAAAPDATILVATCKATQTTDGVHLAIKNLVNSENPPRIISISYGACETSMLQTLRVAFKHLYQQAVMEGISVFVAAGDTGPESCVGNESPPYVPSQATGNGVDGWVSTPYDVAVGGTDFGDTYAKTNLTYWAKKSSASTDWGSALSYIPEIPWNDTCASALTATYYGFALTYGSAGFCNSPKAANLSPIMGTNGGPSTCATGDFSTSPTKNTCKGYPKPSW